VLSLYANHKLVFINIDKISNIHVKYYLERCGFFSYLGHCIPITKTDTTNLFEITTINENTISKIKEMDILTTKFLQSL